MTTPNLTMTPDFTPFLRMMQLQTRFAVEASQGMMKLAMLPWSGMPTGFGTVYTPMGSVTVETSVTPAAAPAKTVVAEPVAEVVEVAAEPVPEAVEVVETVAEPVADVAEPEAEPVAEVVETVAEAALVEEPAPVVEESIETMIKPETLAAPKGAPDDLTVLNGVGPKLAEALNAQGIYHLAQIADWSEANVAWVDENLPGVRGRASRNAWVAQAADLGK